MRTIPTALMMIVCYGAVVPAGAQDTLSDRPIAQLVADLGSSSESERESANDTLKQIVWLISSSDLATRLPPESAGWHPFIPVVDVATRKRAARWRQQLQTVAPALVEFLKKTPPDSDLQCAVMCLSVATRDGSLLLDARDHIPESPLGDALFFSAFLQTAMMTMPGDRSVFKQLVLQLEELAPAKRSALDDYWNRRNEPDSFVWLQICGPQAILLVGQLTGFDRIDVELSQLTRLLDNRYPSFARAASMVLLAELREDARPCIAALEQVMHDDKEEDLRELAAQALIAIHRYETEYVDRILDSVDLEEKDILEIQEFAKTKRQENDEFLAFMIESRTDPDFAGEFEKIPKMVESDHQYYRRSALRTLGDMGPHGQFALPQIRTALKSTDDETRRLAKIAIQRVAR